MARNLDDIDDARVRRHQVISRQYRLVLAKDYICVLTARRYSSGSGALLDYQRQRIKGPSREVACGNWNLPSKGRRAAYKVRFASCSRLFLQMTGRSSANSAPQIYQDLMHQETNVPSTLDFAFMDRDGSVIERHLPSGDLRLGNDIPIGRPLMDLLFQVLVCKGPARVLSAASLPLDVEKASIWMCTNPPPSVWRGLRMVPLLAEGRWSLLVAEYRGPGADLYVPYPTGSLISIYNITRDVVVLDPSYPSSDVDRQAIKPRTHSVGSQKVIFHPSCVRFLHAGRRRSSTLFPVHGRFTPALEIRIHGFRSPRLHTGASKR